MNRQAYLDGYRSKEAFNAFGAAAKTGETGAELLAAALPYILVAPAVLGAGAGLAHSKLTSPSDLDKETVQKALEVAELEEFAAEIQRRKKQAEIEKRRAEIEKENPSARTIHI
jgi:methionine-rich copper-binding protein CopC